MRRGFLLFLVLCVWEVFCTLPADAQYSPIQGFCEDGNGEIKATDLSTRIVQQSFPSCTVTVFDTETTNAAKIYSSPTGAALPNPFMAGRSGQWAFYGVPGQHYDIRFSGSSFPTFTRFDLVAPIPAKWTSINPGYANAGLNTLNSGSPYSLGCLNPSKNPPPANALICLPIVAQFDTAHPNTDGNSNASLMAMQGVLILNNTSGINGYNNIAIVGNAIVNGEGGSTEEVYSVYGDTVMTAGTVNHVFDGVAEQLDINGGTILGYAAAGEDRINQTGGNVAGHLVGRLISSIQPSGGTNGGITGLQINDQGQANTALQVGNADNRTGVSFFYGSLGVFGNGGEFNDNALLRVGPGPGVTTTSLSIYGTGDVKTKGRIEAGTVITVGSILFANLPASPNGSIIYCIDCNATCTAGNGTGRTCFRENDRWTH